MRKYVKKIFIILILSVVSLGAFIYVKADSGWDSDYSSDWGGSDISTSYDSHRDSDDESMSLGEFILIMSLLSPIIVLSIIAYIKKKNNTISNSQYISNNKYQDLSEDDYIKYFNMNKSEFKNKIKNHFIDVQNNWMNFDYEKLRQLCTDELYNQYKTQLDLLKLKNEQNIMNNFKVNNISVYKVEKVNNIVEVNVYLDIEFKDYVINTINKKIVRGNSNLIFNNCYELTLISSINDKLTNCPSCGASIEVISSNTCEYCKNVIVQTSNELVLSKKKIVSSRKW